jgi:hypothetical protein
MTGLLWNVAAVGGILLLAGAAGCAASDALFPRGAVGRCERLAWGFAVGLLLLAGFVPLSLSAGIRPGWLPFLLLCGSVAAAGRFLRPLPPGERSSERAGTAEVGAYHRVSHAVLLFLLFLGVLLYLLRALTEPMWATDFLAIWGWKGKTIFGAAAVPDWTWRMPELSFTHPEYPIGLPLLYAGVSFLLRRWDDHAMAILFPALQIATLALLWGWLRRRATPPLIALATVSALALFEPLYRAFTAGMAEVPLSFFLLMLGTALDDVLDGERGAIGRLALAAAGAAALKNEGLFAAGVAAALALAAARRPWPRRLRAAAAALLPAFAVEAAHRLLRGALPLRDFRFGLIFAPEFAARLGLALRTILLETVLPATPALLAFGLLLWAGRRAPEGDRLLTLAAISLAAYAILPAFCVWGPDWLARTAFARTAAALAPLAAAGAALRLAPLFSSSVNRES